MLTIILLNTMDGRAAYFSIDKSGFSLSGEAFFMLGFISLFCAAPELRFLGGIFVGYQIIKAKLSNGSVFYCMAFLIVYFVYIPIWSRTNPGFTCQLPEILLRIQVFDSQKKETAGKCRIRDIRQTSSPRQCDIRLWRHLCVGPNVKPPEQFIHCAMDELPCIGAK